ncbi:MAG: toll/interleukin-1 receptor domain-containing protein [Pyrinomonadaceae bacterium]
MPNENQYDLFISYSSADRPWAQKLFDDLRARGVNPYFDRERLDVGRPWETQLAQAVRGSKSLVVLWSGNAEKSSWVRREMGTFEAAIDPQGINEFPPDRHYFILVLEGDNDAYGSIQKLTALREADAYGGGVAGLAGERAAAWRTSVNAIADTIKRKDSALLMPRAVVTMLDAEFRQLELRRPADVDTIVTNLGLPGRGDLQKCYGATREDWKPFNSVRPIRDILDDLKNAINAKLGATQIRWEPVDLLSGTEKEAGIEAGKLLNKPSVVVIDPVSLYHEEIYRRFQFLNKCFASDTAVVMVLTPFSVSPSTAYLRDMVREIGRPLFEPYYDPSEQLTEHFAHCGIDISDETEIQRFLHYHYSMSQRARRSQTKSVPFTSD